MYTKMPLLIPYISPGNCSSLSPFSTLDSTLISKMEGRQDPRNLNRDHPHAQTSNLLVRSVAMSASTMSTVLRVQERHRTLNPAINYSLHDNTSNGYEWLLPGWIAEERIMPSGRIYRYYYDPAGHFYRTKREVLVAWDAAGVVVVDP